jgi:hypothetical protein
MTPDLLGAALEYAREGWRVFPCVPRGPRAKAPLLPHGHHDASADPDVIRGWWRRWPNAMIGAAVPDSMLVVDIDPRNDGTVEALEAAAGPLPETLTCWSGRGDGGRHLYFLRPPGELTGGNLPKGVDLKVAGYTILPPSVHPASGRPYWWELHEVARLTPTLRELLRRAPVLPRSARQMGSRGTGAALVRLVASLRDGERNRGLFWAACRAGEDGILAAVTPDLLAAAVATGLPERDALRTIESAARKTGASR